jgi:hypothetical protein
MNITPQDLNLIESTFKSANTTVKTKPCRIKFRGKFITTASKKTVWRNCGFAKSALLNHFQTDYSICTLAGTLYGISTDRGYYSCKDLIRELENQNLVEYVEVDLEEFAQQKD